MDKNLKIKPLTKQQIIISLDRLTRFKPTEEKYLRVFKEIILSNVICPKYKKVDLESMDYKLLVSLVEQVFNCSLALFGLEGSNDYSINKSLSEYERTVYYFDSEVDKLVNNKIDYKAFMNLLEDKDLPINLKWFKTLAFDVDQVGLRENEGLMFPVQKLILVEGITEEILLPKLAKRWGFDFTKAGIYLISAGGKNQVVKLFYHFTQILRIPIFVLLDNDAGDNFDEIKPRLRQKDKVHVIEKGEFEDILPLNLIKRTLNRKFSEYFRVSLDDLRQGEQMTKVLHELLKEHGFEFKKAEFASLVAQNIQDEKDVSQEVREICLQISER